MGCAAELEAMEDSLLHFGHFSSAEALALGALIVAESRKYGEDIVVRILRQTDGIPMFQYVGDSCRQRNLEFAMMKAKTVELTAHCSLWALAQEETIGGVDAVFSADNGNDLVCLPAGGAFPIFAGGELAAIVATSGLHNGNDHRAVVDALCAYLKKKVPTFSGVIS